MIIRTPRMLIMHHQQKCIMGTLNRVVSVIFTFIYIRIDECVSNNGQIAMVYFHPK